MSRHLIEIDLAETNTQANELFKISSTASEPFMARLNDVLIALEGGSKTGAINAKISCDYASIVGTFTGNPSNGETVTIAGQTIQSVTSGAAANQFNIAASASGNASAMAAAINASAVLSPWVNAVASAATVTVYANVPGVIGNAITLADSMSNFTWAGSATRLASGAQATNINYSFGASRQTTNA